MTAVLQQWNSCIIPYLKETKLGSKIFGLEKIYVLVSDYHKGTVKNTLFLRWQRT